MVNRVRVDIECGHHVLNSRYSQVEIQELSVSAEIATRLADQLRAHGFEVGYSLLIDDKRLTTELSIYDHVHEISSHAHGLEFDRIILESSLGELLPDLIESIIARERSRLKKEAKKWRSAHNGYLACSQDVAIWHSLRLGLVTPKVDVSLKDNSNSLVSEECTTVCISVLPRRLLEFEERAQREILRYVLGYQSENVHQLYFGFNDKPIEREGKINSIVRRITRIAARQEWLNDSYVAVPRADSLPSPVLTDIDLPLARQRYVVVGAGVVGLSSAIRLRLAGAHVEVISSPNVAMVSAVACALWLPACLNKADGISGCDISLESVARDSWNCYKWLLNELGQSAGVRRLIHHEYIKSGQDDPPYWLQNIFSSSDLASCRLKWGGVTYDRIWKFSTIVIDMTKYMSWLRRWADSLGIIFDVRHLGSLDEASSSETSAIINCSGLGAKSLARDWSVRPVRGQVLFLEAIDETDIESLVGVGIDEYCLVPRIKDIGVGSLFEDVDDSNHIEPRYSQKSEDKLRAAVGILAELCGVDRLSLEFSGRSAVGLRPSRTNGARLEAEQRHSGLVIHNYGHGGGGVTLAWGCASQVARLASSLLAESDSPIADRNLPVLPVDEKSQVQALDRTASMLSMRPGIRERPDL
jgi:D-amino-acid oxidase